MSLSTTYNGSLFEGGAPKFLTNEQMSRLTSVFKAWYRDKSINDYRRLQRGRYWLVFLMLRHTGARISEVANLKLEDIDFKKKEVRLITLKRHNPAKRGMYRVVPIPKKVLTEIEKYLDFCRVSIPPDKYKKKIDRLFNVYRNNFYTTFQERCQEANIPKELAHPHVLRHTRAIELLRAGVPVTIVQDLLGHSALTTTAVYLRMSGQEAKGILREKGLI